MHRLDIFSLKALNGRKETAVRTSENTDDMVIIVFNLGRERDMGSESYLSALGRVRFILS